MVLPGVVRDMGLAEDWGRFWPESVGRGLTGQKHPKDGSTDDHGQTEDLAHRKKPPDKADLWVGLAEKLNKETHNSIAT